MISFADCKPIWALTIGINQPYAPADQVYYTVERHASPRGLPAVMIEIRNDEITDATGERRWSDRLADILMMPKSPACSKPRRGVVLA